MISEDAKIIFSVQNESLNGIGLHVQNKGPQDQEIEGLDPLLFGP